MVSTGDGRGLWECAGGPMCARWLAVVCALLFGLGMSAPTAESDGSWNSRHDWPR